jgi:hypothetical protein
MKILAGGIIFLLGGVIGVLGPEAILNFGEMFDPRNRGGDTPLHGGPSDLLRLDTRLNDLSSRSKLSSMSTGVGNYCEGRLSCDISSIHDP